MKTHRILDVESGKVQEWTVEAMLHEINRDRSSKWTDYDEGDYIEGWMEWVEGEFYKLID